jgi:hypothetical protein
VVSPATNSIVSEMAVGYEPYATSCDPVRGLCYVSNLEGGTISILSHAPTYPVTFTETGLPAGTTWSTVLGGVQLTTTANAITFHEPNGSFGYAVGAVTGYTPNPSSGSVVVDGAAVDRTVTFSSNATSPPTTRYAVTFSQTGLPAGTSWNVTLNGTLQVSQLQSVTFSEPNGSYRFIVGPARGYTIVPASGTVEVTGSTVSEAIDYTPISPPPSLPSNGSSAPKVLGLPPVEGYVLIGGVLLLVFLLILAVALVSRRRQRPPNAVGSPPPAGAAGSASGGASNPPPSGVVGPAPPGGEYPPPPPR